MPGQGRLGDKAYADADAHGCPGCPHPTAGPAIAGSNDVFVNGRPALRVDDVGIHAACCGANQWRATHGSATVFINGKPAHRLNDETRHCGGAGRLIEGSQNVFVGDQAEAAASSASKPARFKLVGQRGRPLAGLTLIVEDATGARQSHTTDGAGLVELPASAGDEYKLVEVRDGDEILTVEGVS